MQAGTPSTGTGWVKAAKKAGKAALTVPKGMSVIPAAAVGERGRSKGASLLAAVSTDGRLLLFELEELPELGRGKGSKILGLPSKSGIEMAAICVLEAGQALKIISGQRHMTLKPKDLDHYVGVRGRRGRALPRGWRKVERLLVG